jgi:hypothetical protein
VDVEDDRQRAGCAPRLDDPGLDLAGGAAADRDPLLVDLGLRDLAGLNLVDRLAPLGRRKVEQVGRVGRRLDERLRRRLQHGSPRLGLDGCGHCVLLSLVVFVFSHAVAGYVTSPRSRSGSPTMVSSGRRCGRSRPPRRRARAGLAQRGAFVVGLVGDRGGLVVADVWAERGYEHQRPANVLAAVLAPSGRVVAENRRKRIRATRAPSQVCMVDPDCLDSDERFSRTRLGVGDLLEPQHLRPASLVHDNRTHDRRRTPDRRGAPQADASQTCDRLRPRTRRRALYFWPSPTLLLI